MTALSDAEAATVARFEAGEPAPESAVEVVARAMWEAQHDSGCPCTWATTRDVEAHPHFRRLARAALAVMAGPDDTTRALLTAAEDLNTLAAAARVLDDTVSAYMLGAVDGGQVARAQRPVRLIVHRIRTATDGAR